MLSELNWILLINVEYLYACMHDQGVRVENWTLLFMCLQLLIYRVYSFVKLISIFQVS